MEKLYIKAVSIARLAGVKKQYVSTEKEKGNLIIDKNRMFDIDNPINADWLRRRGVDMDQLKKTAEAETEKKKLSDAKKKSSSTGRKKKEVAKINKASGRMSEADFESLTGLPYKLHNLTIEQLAMQYGAQMHLKSYIDILNVLMSAMKKDVEIQVRRAELIDRDLVNAHIFQFLDVLLNQFFDWPESIIDGVIAEARADEKMARLKLPEKFRKDFSKIVKQTKKVIIDDLKKLGGGRE